MLWSNACYGAHGEDRGAEGPGSVGRPGPAAAAGVHNTGREPARGRGAEQAHLRDIWAKTDLGVHLASFAATLAAHETKVLLLSPPP